MYRPSILHLLPASTVLDLSAVATQRRYAAGEPIGAGSGESLISIVTAGEVRLSLLAPTGRTAVLATRTPFDIFGLEDAQDVVAEARVSGTELWVLPLARFLQIITHCPPAAGWLIEALSGSLNSSLGVLREYAFHTIKARVAHVLADMAAERAGTVVAATREELAARARLERSRITRTGPHRTMVCPVMAVNWQINAAVRRTRPTAISLK